MIRSEFEELVASSFDVAVNPYGFILVPQPPGHIQESTPMAIYECPVADFQRLLPAIAQRMNLEVSAVDLTVQLKTSTGPVIVDIEGLTIGEIQRLAGLSSQQLAGSIEDQIARMSSELQEALRIISAR